MSRFLQPKCHFECLPDSQVYHFDRLLFTPGTCHSLWILRKSCPQIVCSQRIEGKNGGENHEVRVVNLAGGWSMITLQNGSVTLKLKNDRLMIHDPILSFLRFNMKSYLLKSYYKKLGLKTTCRFPQWFWTRVCTTAKAFLSNFRTDPGDRQHGNGWGLLRLRGSGISQYNCFLVLETKLVCSTDPGESESPPLLWLGFACVGLVNRGVVGPEGKHNRHYIQILCTSQLIWQGLKVQTT